MSVTEEELWAIWGEPAVRDRVTDDERAFHIAGFGCGCEARRLEDDVRWVLAIGCEPHRDISLKHVDVPAWNDF